MQFKAFRGSDARHTRLMSGAGQRFFMGCGKGGVAIRFRASGSRELPCLEPHPLENQLAMHTPLLLGLDQIPLRCGPRTGWKAVEVVLGICSVNFWKVPTGRGTAGTKSSRLWRISLENLEGLKSNQVENFSLFLFLGLHSLLPHPFLLQYLNGTGHIPCVTLGLSRTITSFYPHHASCAQVLWLFHFVHISHQDTEAQRYKSPAFLRRRNPGHILSSSGSEPHLERRVRIATRTGKGTLRAPWITHPGPASQMERSGLWTEKGGSVKSNCNSKLKLQLSLSCRLELLGIS